MEEPQIFTLDNAGPTPVPSTKTMPTSAKWRGNYVLSVGNAGSSPVVGTNSSCVIVLTRTARRQDA